MTAGEGGSTLSHDRSVLRAHLDNIGHDQRRRLNDHLDYWAHAEAFIERLTELSFWLSPVKLSL